MTSSIPSGPPKETNKIESIGSSSNGGNGEVGQAGVVGALDMDQFSDWFVGLLSPFAPQKCVNAAHFRGAKGDNEASLHFELRSIITRLPSGR